MNKVSYRIPLYLVILMNILGFLLLYMMDGKYDVKMLLLGAGLIALFVAVYVALVFFKMGDRLLFPIVSILITVSVLELSEFSLQIGLNQIKFVGIGVVMFFAAFAAFRFLKKWEKIWFVYAGMIVGLIMMTALFGEDHNSDAKLWLPVPGIGVIQPSEFVKIAFIMCIACCHSKSWNKPFLKMPPYIMLAGLTAVMVCGYVVLSDWGSILFFMLIYVFMMYACETRRWFFWLCILGCIVALLLIFFICVEFPDNPIAVKITGRFNGWLNTEEAALGDGHQLMKASRAIASGNYFGMGLGNAGFTSADYYAFESDLIFATICAEMGVFVGAAVIILFFLLAYRCFKIAIAAKNPFNKAVALGISLMYSLQTFMIIGGVLRVVPLTGVTVPFVSAGGSSLLASFTALGIIQAISANEERDGETDD